ncbi:MAG: hypothetical protein LBL66_00830 [Clostridiales bacterium]|jgi:V/A-type H+-transporting ATPase subunit I|nr:hypothetical protein [Clostridiales bacterium]
MNVKVKKIQIIGLAAERRKTLEALKRTGAFELAKPEDVGIEGAGPVFDRAQKEAALTKIARVRFAIDFTAKTERELQAALAANEKAAKQGVRERVTSDYKPQKPPMFAPRPAIGYDNFQLISAQEEELLEHIGRLEADNARLYEIRAEENRLKNARRNAEIYAGLDVPFSAIADTANTFALLGTVRAKETEAFSAFAGREGLAVRYLAAKNGAAGVFVAGLSEQRDAAARELARAGFARCAVAEGKLPAALLAEYAEAADKLYYERLAILKAAPDRAAVLNSLKIYYDYLNSELENLNAQSEMFSTNKTFCVWGWYPASAEERVKNAAAAASKYSLISVREPLQGECPPVCLKNNGLVAPYESVTNMFGPPAPGERDPNAFVAFFFWLFFGMMLADVLYGLILSVSIFIVLKKCKPEKGMKNLLAVVCMGGLSAVLWGVVTGGYMGFEIGGDGSFFRGFINPLEDLMLFMGLSIALGVIQILVGLCLKLAAALKSRRFLDALCDPGFLLILFIGAFMWGSKFLDGLFETVSIPVPALVPQIGLYVILAGLAGMLLTAGRGKKGVGIKIGMAFGALYGLINYIGDILSYVRLFAIGLVGGIIAGVANMIGEMLFGLPIPGLNYALGVAVAAAFHMLNLALGVLSAYVHNSRLQFVEFFGKFYEGGGNEFTPMGSGTKYVRVES